MAEYPINKGVGRQVEFKGLRAQYLFLFAGGLLAVFILVIVLYMGGVDQVACLVAGVGLGGALVALTFRLNRKYGSYGLMKLLAARRHPAMYRLPKKCGKNSKPTLKTMNNTLKTETLERKFPI